LFTVHNFFTIRSYSVEETTTQLSLLRL
jgi:hypothetical protein